MHSTVHMIITEIYFGHARMDQNLMFILYLSQYHFISSRILQKMNFHYLEDNSMCLNFSMMVIYEPEIRVLYTFWKMVVTGP